MHLAKVDNVLLLKSTNNYAWVNTNLLCKCSNGILGNYTLLDIALKRSGRDKCISRKEIRGRFILFRCAINFTNMALYDMCEFVEKTKPESICVTASHCEPHHNLLSIEESGTMQERAFNVGKKNQSNATFG